MKRKLLLMAGSFIILLLAFGTYQLFVPGVAFFNPMGGTRLRPPSLEFHPGEGPGFAPTKEVTLYYRNPEGQLRGVYKASSWMKEDDGSLTLENPQAVVYQRDGTRVYLRADRGRVWAEEVAGGSGFNIRHGQADGKVEIFYDQSTDDKYKGEERPHPKDRPYDEMIHDVLRIVTTDVKFSRDLLELSTDSEVTLWSRQIDMNGRGLLLQWNENPREIRLLRLEKGNILVVKDLPEQVDLTQLPIEDTQTPETQPTTQPETAATTAPATTEDGWGLVTASTTTTPGAQPGRDVNVVVESRPGAPKRTPRIAPPLPEGPKMRNIYRATFHESVRIFSGNRSLKGANELALKFEWDRAWKSEKKESPSSTTQTAAAPETNPPATHPTTGPTTQPKWASQVAAAGVRDMKLDEEKARSSDRQMVIYWDGPLEIQPKGRTETPSRKRYTISGNGKQVRLTDEDARILCTKFEFKNPQQEAWFEGTKESPSRVQLARGDEITCRGRIRFVRSLGKAYLEGPGELVRYARDEEMTNWNLVPIEQAPWRLLLDRITWGEKVEASFDERKMPTKDGKEETRPYIKDAVFHQNVKMVQFARPTPRGEEGEIENFAKATERLHVWMGLTDEGKNYPKRLEADGNVHAGLQGSNIQAGHVEISLRPSTKEDEAEKTVEPKIKTPPVKKEKSLTTDSPEAAKVAKVEPEEEDQERDEMSFLGGSVEPTSFYASGDVNITYADPKKPEESPLRIEADMARASDIDTKQGNVLAVLTGTPVAKLWQGERSIEGEIIRFDGQAGAVKVEGRGKIRYLTDQDLSGNRLEKERSLEISWAKQMLYHGQAGQCIFDHDVKYKSGEEKISCPKQIRIFFQPKESGSRADASQPVPPGVRAFSMGVDNFSNADFTSIEAEGEEDEKYWVRMETARLHSKNRNWVLQRRQIRGQQIIYSDKKGVVKVNGPGDCLVEDYRKPKKRDNESRRLSSINQLGGQIDRPSQTLFRWKKDMLFQQPSRYVRLREDVFMAHRSGIKMIPIVGLQPQPFGKMDKGRATILRAGQLDAWFGEPDKKIAMRDEHGRVKDSDSDTTRQLLEGGPDFGDLKLFKAEKDVTMEMGDDGSEYGRTIVDGEKVLYDDVRKIIEVSGFLEGATKRTESQITIEDRRAGVPPKTVRAPVLIYDLKEDVIRMDTLTGGGGR